MEFAADLPPPPPARFLPESEKVRIAELIRQNNRIRNVSSHSSIALELITILPVEPSNSRGGHHRLPNAGNEAAAAAANSRQHKASHQKVNAGKAGCSGGHNLCPRGHRWRPEGPEPSVLGLLSAKEGGQNM